MDPHYLRVVNKPPVRHMSMPSGTIITGITDCEEPEPLGRTSVIMESIDSIPEQVDNMALTQKTNSSSKSSRSKTKNKSLRTDKKKHGSKRFQVKV